MPESALPANIAAVRRLLVVAVAVLVCITPSCSDHEPHPGLVVIGIDGLSGTSCCRCWKRASFRISPG